MDQPAYLRTLLSLHLAQVWTQQTCISMDEPTAARLTQPLSRHTEMGQVSATSETKIAMTALVILCHYGLVAS